MDASWLAVAAQLAGVAHFSPPTAPPPAATPKALLAPAPARAALGSVDLAAIAAETGSWRRLDVLGRSLELSAGFAADETPRVLIKENSAQTAFSLAQLQAGATASLPGGPLALGYRDGLVLIGPASLRLDDLLAAVYARALKLELPAGVRYALLLEGAPDKPDAVVMLRRDSEGLFWIGWHPATQLGAVDWLCAIDGVLYGMKLDGPRLTFWSEPLPPIAAAAALPRL